jgi:hypothetical protein
MSYTKGEVVKAALNEIGIADYEFDISPEELTSGVRRLDSMMAEWSAKNIRVNYPMSGTPEGSSADDDSGLPDSAWEAVTTNLALRLAPSFGKSPSPGTVATASRSYSTLLGLSTKPRERQLNSLPRGQGYKSHRNPFTNSPVEEYLKEVDQTVDTSGGYDGGS